MDIENLCRTIQSSLCIAKGDKTSEVPCSTAFLYLISYWKFCKYITYAYILSVESTSILLLWENKWDKHFPVNVLRKSSIIKKLKESFNGENNRKYLSLFIYLNVSLSCIKVNFVYKCNLLFKTILNRVQKHCRNSTGRTINC